MLRKSTWIVALSAALLGSCYYDNEEALYGITTCDSTVIGTFAADVLPILDARCNNCHAGSSPSGDIALDTYTEVVKYVNNGSLVGSIRHASGFSAMPRNSGKLNPCDIQKITSWVDAGAANN